MCADGTHTDGVLDEDPTDFTGPKSDSHNVAVTALADWLVLRMKLVGPFLFQNWCQSGCSGARYLLPGTWYQVPGTWHQVQGTWHQVPGTRYQVPGTWRYQALGTRHLGPDPRYWYTVPGTRYLVPGT